jgi:cytochrome c
MPNRILEVAMIRRAVFTFALLALAAPALADGDVDEGKKVFNQCKACHTVDKGGKNAVGPNLNGVFGRKSGTLDSFKYSDAMKNAGIVWSEETIGKYVADPKGFVTGNKMTFAGLKRDKQVADVIAYLKDASK